VGQPSIGLDPAAIKNTCAAETDKPTPDAHVGCRDSVARGRTGLARSSAVERSVRGGEGWGAAAAATIRCGAREREK
jgi:hypothetical protein